MADLMMIILIIFLLIIVSLILSVSTHLNIVSKESTYSGGFQRPSLIADAIIGDSKKSYIFTYQLNYEKDILVSADVECKFSPQMFANLLAFVDPGEIIYKDRKLPMLTIRNKNYEFETTPDSFEVLDSGKIKIWKDGISGFIDNSIMWGVIKSIWPEFDADDFRIPIAGRFQVNQRPQIYYESIEKGDQKQIIIGHCVLDIHSKEIGIFNSLATALTDFVYLGPFDKDERIQFLVKYDGPDAANYYETWAQASDSFEGPFVKYSKSREEFIRYRMLRNITPPQWVKEEFLDKIGANLKIMGSTENK
ncbi:MAG: hypothetical protein KKA81_13160 [Bacteroidetes bacterium]|nr:hypothetical protein [Bacteroidota bacterium]